ncbi:conserved hypothetical protein [Histoplasma capsulatum H143]|uniref:Uncharacterized protein n=1 Tax=Ajellomyces capsulatus (strain H143) TaxID=544712 RepID=C6HFF4_AJECH|nr:conserved hypothetical protein [Histoplasma capsulatum H143]
MSGGGLAMLRFLVSSEDGALLIFSSNQSSLQPPPPGNPRKWRSADILSSQAKKILPDPPMGTCLSDAIQAAHTLEDSAREGIPADNILNVDNMAKTAVDTGSIFKPSSFFTRDATIAALESIVRCWAPTSGLIPTEDLKRWYKGLSGNEITALSTLAWHFGSDEVGLSEICSFISFHPDDAGGLENIWGVEFQDFCRFRVSASHHEAWDEGGLSFAR